MRLSCLESFFSGFWNRIVYKCRYIILFVFTIWAAFAVTFAMNIETYKKEDSVLLYDNMIERTQRELDNAFPPIMTDVINN